MSETERIRLDALEEIMGEVGIKATPEQLKHISESFMDHIDMEHELNSYSYSIPVKEKCSACKDKDIEIARLEEREEVFIKSVKLRRNADSVWIEGNSVMYR